MIKVLIADDHPVVRDGLRAMLATQPDMEVVGEAATGSQAVERAQALRPVVVLMDLQMPELDGPAAIATLREREPAVHVLVVTTFGSDADITRAIDSPRVPASTTNALMARFGPSAVRANTTKNDAIVAFEMNVFVPSRT